VPHKGWVMWDDVGVSLSHRKWQSDANFQIMQVIQSFRYKFINVVFCLPSASYLDKVVREMCHYVLRLQERGIANVYRIRKSPYQGWTYTPFLGTIHSELPTKMLLDEFRRLHAEHQERLYEQSRKGLTVQERRKEDQLAQALKPKATFDDVLEKAKLLMPQIVNDKAWSDQGRINMPEMMKLLKVSQNTAYRVRKELLKIYHEQDNARASQAGLTTTREEPSSSQEEERTK
jgi:hypothetical protein